MLKIGPFSLAARVSVRTLRHYDDLGLLRPARVDPATGYRFYALDQLPRLHRILALKDLGFALDQIAQVLDEGLPPGELRGMLRLRQAEARQHVALEQARLARIEARLRQLEQGDDMQHYDVVIKSVPAQRVVSIREVLPAYPAVGRLFGELFAFAAAHGLKPSTPITIWHDPEYRESDVDGEAAFATDDPVPTDDRVRARELAAVPEMACTVHHGAYVDLGRAYAALTAWIDANGYRVAGPGREVNHKGGPDQHDPSYVTELQFPVAKA